MSEYHHVHSGMWFKAAVSEYKVWHNLTINNGFGLLSTLLWWKLCSEYQQAEMAAEPPQETDMESSRQHQAFQRGWRQHMVSISLITFINIQLSALTHETAWVWFKLGLIKLVFPWLSCNTCSSLRAVIHLLLLQNSDTPHKLVEIDQHLKSNFTV